MPSHDLDELPVELEAIATAAAEQIHARADAELDDVVPLSRRVAEAASVAIASGASLSAIAAAERTGHERARAALAPDALKRVSRAAVRRRAADDADERELMRAVRIGVRAPRRRRRSRDRTRDRPRTDRALRAPDDREPFIEPRADAAQLRGPAWQPAW